MERIYCLPLSYKVSVSIMAFRLRYALSACISPLRYLARLAPVHKQRLSSIL
nr:MAG TPA: hypothetical protein [Caudoviricetes sp.]